MENVMDLKVSEIFPIPTTRTRTTFPSNGKFILTRTTSPKGRQRQVLEQVLRESKVPLSVQDLVPLYIAGGIVVDCVGGHEASVKYHLNNMIKDGSVTVS
jgi:hypothetical protein